MIDDLVVDTRELAIAKTREALKEFVICEVKTRIPLHIEILESAEFILGKYDAGDLSLSRAA